MTDVSLATHYDGFWPGYLIYPPHICKCGHIPIATTSTSQGYNHPHTITGLILMINHHNIHDHLRDSDITEEYM